MKFDLTKAFHAPELAAPFGFDAYGFALHERILNSIFFSFKTALFISLTGLMIAVVLAFALSQVKTWKKQPLLIFLDTINNMPSLLLVLFVVCASASSKRSLFLSLLLTSMPHKLRFTYNLILKIQKSPYLESAKAVGASPFRTLYRYYWSELKPILVPLTSWSLGYVILTEAVLSFLGLGNNFENPSLGKLLLEGKWYFIEAPHLLLFPSMTLLVILYTLNQVADLIKDP